MRKVTGGVRKMAVLLAVVLIGACLAAGCGGKYDKPLEIDRTIRMGEYSYQPAYHGFENSTSMSISGGTIYVAFADTSSQPPSGQVLAYHSNGGRVPQNLIKPFNGLARPMVVGAGKYLVAVADVADTIKVKVYSILGGDPVVSFADSDWSQISGLAVDDTGNVYVADAAKDFVRSYKPDGKKRFAVDLADSGYGIGHVLRPTSIFLDGETLLISEGHTDKAQVQRIRIDRPQTGIPFSSESPFINSFTDAEGNEIQLMRPIGVAAGKEGNIFVLDQGLGKVFSYDSQGHSITVVNTAQSGGPADLTDAACLAVYNPKSGESFAEASIYVLEAVKGLLHRWDPKSG